MKVTKRNGEVEDFNLEKIHKVINWAIEEIDDVSLSDIEMNTKLNIYDGIPTREIHKVLIKSADNLTSEDTPNYQYVAARLAIYALRKDVWGGSEAPRLCEHITSCVNEGFYDRSILDRYTQSEIHKLHKYVKHDRDYLYTYAGIQQMMDKYLVKNRVTGQIYETPQFLYMLVAMTAFANYPKKSRLEYVKRCYDYLSTFKISLPTPILAGLRTKVRQFASCCLIDIDDSLDSITSSVSAIIRYISKRAGLGVNVGRIRPIGSPIRNGEVRHTGLIPYLKLIESAVKSCHQGGIRDGSCTVNVPFWHYEIEDVIHLKNDVGTEDKKVRKLDYCISFSKIFYDRVIADKEITLFSTAEAEGLYEAFGTPEFDALYERYERDLTLQFRKRIKAREFATEFLREALETGRIYLMNIDHVNSHSSWIDLIKMTNLCVEVTHPTKIMNHIDDIEAEIGLCILAALNMLEVKKEEYPLVCDMMIRILNQVINNQEYAVKAAETFCKNRRSLGVGFTNVAAFLAKNKVAYDSKEALVLMDEYSELLQYHLLDSSAELAKEMGYPCAKYERTKYSQGIFPLDTYKKDVDSIVDRHPSCDWDSLRKKVQTYGLYNSSVSCQMPCESSSVVQNNTNGHLPVQDLVVYKGSKSKESKQVVPNVSKYGKYYTRAFDIASNSVHTNMTAVLQKWFDMSVSHNHYYNYANFKDGVVSLSQMLKDMLYDYKMGVKTRYYVLTPNKEEQPKGCESGACSI